MRFSDLRPGYEFPPATLGLDTETVRRYLAATEDDSAVYRQDGAVPIVPPLAVAALSFQGIAQGLALEPGSLHTGQELVFRRPVAIGERLTAEARVATGSKRRDFTALVVESTVIDDMGEEAVSGRMTLMVAGGTAGVGGGDGRWEETRRRPDARLDEPAPRPVIYAPLDPTTIAVGSPLPEVARRVTQERIDAYAAASGDYNPIHIDPAFAAASPFGGTVAHGMLLLAYVSTMLTRAFGPAWPGTGALKVRFRTPAPAGATVTTHGQVARVEQGDGVQYAVCAVLLRNAAGEALITGEARVHVHAST